MASTFVSCEKDSSRMGCGGFGALTRLRWCSALSHRTAWCSRPGSFSPASAPINARSSSFCDSPPSFRGVVKISMAWQYRASPPSRSAHSFRRVVARCASGPRNGVAGTTETGPSSSHQLIDERLDRTDRASTGPLCCAGVTGERAADGAPPLAGDSSGGGLSLRPSLRLFRKAVHHPFRNIVIR